MSRKNISQIIKEQLSEEDYKEDTKIDVRVTKDSNLNEDIDIKHEDECKINKEKLEIIITTKWIPESEIQELQKWNNPAQNRYGVMLLNGQESYNQIISDFEKYDVLLICIRKKFNRVWLSQNLDLIGAGHKDGKYNVTVVSKKFQSNQKFVQVIKEYVPVIYRVRHIPTECVDRDTFIHKLHTIYINEPKSSTISCLKDFLGFVLGH